MLSRLNRLSKLRFLSSQSLKLTTTTTPFTPFQPIFFRPLITTPTLKMPEPLHSSEVTTKTDPSVSKQYDSTASFETKFEDFYGIVDKLKIGLLGTYRPNVGPVHRSMAVAKRTGPDFLFLANLHSQKFRDIEDGKDVVSVSFQNSSTQDWVSVTGKAVKTTGEDPRIGEVWTKGTKAWFGDLGDGKHDGGPEDPRMGLIEVQANYITYWKHDVSTLGFAKEVAGAVITGGVANTGTLREMKEDEIKQARDKHSAMSA